MKKMRNSQKTWGAKQSMLAVINIGSEACHVSVLEHQMKQRDLQQASGFCSRCSRNGRCPRSNLDAHASTCPCNGAADVLQGDVWGVGLLDLRNLKDGLGRDLPRACMPRSLAPLLETRCLLNKMCDRRRLGGLQWQQQGLNDERLRAAAPCRGSGSQGGGSECGVMAAQQGVMQGECSVKSHQQGGWRHAERQ